MRVCLLHCVEASSICVRADLYLSSIPHVVYQAADLNAQHTTAMNKGNEATIYLQYIIDNYDNLPHQVIFSHGAS